MDIPKKEVVPFDKIPMTIPEAMRWATDYYHLKEGISRTFKKTTESYLICGCLLNDAHSKKIWIHDGSGANSFNEWVEKEMGFKRSQVQRMMQIWSSLKPIIEKQLALILEVDYSKLALISPYIMKLNEDEQEEMLLSAKDLSCKALEANLAEKNGKVAQDVCEHLGQMEEWYRCPKCSKFFKKEVK